MATAPEKSRLSILKNILIGLFLLLMPFVLIFCSFFYLYWFSRSEITYPNGVHAYAEGTFGQEKITDIIIEYPPVEPASSPPVQLVVSGMVIDLAHSSHAEILRKLPQLSTSISGRYTITHGTVKNITIRHHIDPNGNLDSIQYSGYSDKKEPDAYLVNGEQRLHFPTTRAKMKKFFGPKVDEKLLPPTRWW